MDPLDVLCVDLEHPLVATRERQRRPGGLVALAERLQVGHVLAQQRERPDALDRSAVAADDPLRLLDVGASAGSSVAV